MLYLFKIHILQIDVSDLFNAPDVFLIRLTLPCIDRHTTLSNSGRGVVLSGEYVAT